MNPVTVIRTDVFRSAFALTAAAMLLTACDTSPKSDTPSEQPAADLFEPVSVGTADSAFSSEADSLAREMAKTFGELTTRTGTLVQGGDTSRWTARFQGDNIVIIEEHASRPNRTAARVYFFKEAGGLEQVSEQSLTMKADGSVETTETQVDFTGIEPHAIRQLGGKSVKVSDQELQQYVLQADALVSAARATRAPGK